METTDEDSEEIQELPSGSSLPVIVTANVPKSVLDYDALYDRIRQSFQKLVASNVINIRELDVQHKSLAPILRPYQSDAVRWMLTSEQDQPGQGGILADEMGLGKTVEVLALILNHQRMGLPCPEYLEPVASDDNPLSCGPSPKKKLKINNSCDTCSSKFQSIENIMWRDSDDTVKSSIQAVIDKNCKDIKCTCDQLSVRERLNTHYQQQLNQYSGLRSLYKDQNDKESQFLCVCGKPQDDIPSSTPLKCSQCSKVQHSSCVHYDIKDPYRGEYFCPRCWATKEQVPSGATLIITPSSICHQWVEEIRRHVLPENEHQLRILVYQGVSSCGYHQPVWLARNHDIIITTYEILRKELYFAQVSDASSRPRRTAAVYMAPPSPLLAINFWRLVLDEAQMVEGSSTRAAEMARRFTALQKWAVTGTPIQKSIHDLKGLFMFLNIEPDRCVYSDPDKLTDLLAPIFWRTRKSQVLDQIGVPPQSEKIHWLNFSPVEEHFYKQQAIDCAQDALGRLNKFKESRGGGPEVMSTKLSNLDASTVNSLLAPLLRLRQACVHPQMVRGQFLTLKPHSKTLTMEELLKSLIKRSQVECEEAQRLRVAAANGLAALHIIKKEYGLAVEKYRDVLRWAEELKDSVQTDTLQRLHTVHNLADVLSLNKREALEVIPPTLRDDQLSEEAESLRQKYLGRAQTALDSARMSLAPITAKVACFSGELDANREQLDDMWWTAALEWAEKQQLSQRLVLDIREKLIQSTPNKGANKVPQFNTTDGLKFLLFSRLEEMGEKREEVVKKMRRLELTPAEDLSGKAADCHLRPMEGRRKNTKEKCSLCLVHNVIEDYESLLFAMDERNNAGAEEEEAVEEGEPEGAVLEQLRRGTWADSQAEKMLKFLLQFIRKQHCNLDGIQQGGQIHLKLVDAWKKEFRQLRVVWRSMNDRASAVDELAMATIRFRIRLEHELASSQPEGQIYLMEAHEVDFQLAKLKGDLVAAGNTLKRHMGQSFYLKNLELAGFGQTGMQNPEPCPVCRNQLGIRWSVLLCGHCYCMDCIQLLIQQCKGMKNLRCAICREVNALGEISYVEVPNKEDKNDENKEAIVIRGSHSTKVEAVVRQLLIIKAEDPSSKCLVFSTWTDVLMIVSRALDENGIQHCMLRSGHAQQQLNRFKREPDVTALLLPIQSGANGLNLIEATHVLLMEPVLNPGSELQAIGRVHRIGQTRPTFVHRFLVKKTIEENMSAMLGAHRAALLSRSAGSVRENPVTLADLQALFLGQHQSELEHE